MQNVTQVVDTKFFDEVKQDLHSKFKSINDKVKSLNDELQSINKKIGVLEVNSLKTSIKIQKQQTKVDVIAEPVETTQNNNKSFYEFKDILNEKRQDIKVNEDSKKKMPKLVNQTVTSINIENDNDNQKGVPKMPSLKNVNKMIDSMINKNTKNNTTIETKYFGDKKTSFNEIFKINKNRKSKYFGIYTNRYFMWVF